MNDILRDRTSPGPKKTINYISLNPPSFAVPAYGRWLVRSKKSDHDLLVEFEKMQPAEHAEPFFGLAEDLEYLLNHPVDLVEPGQIHNPYLRKSLEETQDVIYTAA